MAKQKRFKQYTDVRNRTRDLHIGSPSCIPKYDKQDQQGKTAFNERNHHMTHTYT
jgi:hypothetical protein